MAELTPRERVEMVLNHEEPDRVPVDFGGMNTSIYEMPDWWPNKLEYYGYKALVEYLALKEVPKPYLNAANCVINVDERILNRYGVDFQYLYMSIPKPKMNPDGTVETIFKLKVKPVGYYMEVYDPPLGGKITFKDIDSFGWPDPEDPVFSAKAKKRVLRMRENSDRVIVALASFAEQIFQNYAWIRGFTQMLLDMQRDPELFHYFTDTLLSVEEGIIESFYSEVGEYIDFAYIAEDMGTQQAPFVSPEQYKEFWKPYHKRMIKHIKQFTGARIMWHCCGAIEPLIPHLIDLGVDVLQVIQPLARGMEPESLKKSYGDKLTFNGGIDVQRLLPKGTPEEIRAECKRVIRILGRNGGYIFAPSHNIQPDTPPQNVVAMLEAGVEHGKYPLEE
ncbi:MAG: uroporphyrinogen decarboxylase family protein [Candidatus Freyarchaeota archaeon]